MKIGVLGTGMVGETIATKLAELGHDVHMGSRSADNQGALAWARKTGGGAGTFADVAASGELLFNCTAGAHSLEALQAAGEENLAGKVLVDVANPLDFSDGALSLSVCNTDSLAERIQRAFPRARVVKALNTVNCGVMVNPEGVPGDHVVFVCGDEEEAKRQTIGLLGDWGWPAERIVDLGPISGARAAEMYLPLWLAMVRALGTAQFNIEIKQPR